MARQIGERKRIAAETRPWATRRDPVMVRCKWNESKCVSIIGGCFVVSTSLYVRFNAIVYNSCAVVLLYRDYRFEMREKERGEKRMNDVLYHTGYAERPGNTFASHVPCIMSTLKRKIVTPLRHARQSAMGSQFAMRVRITVGRPVALERSVSSTRCRLMSHSSCHCQLYDFRPCDKFQFAFDVKHTG